MTTAQLNAMRTLAESMSRPEQTMTAREMALTSHNLDRTGDKATLKTGEVYYWNTSREVWVR
jgi:phosphoribosyl-AMP cyclohydrolase